MRIVDYLERSKKIYKGLNLTAEVRDGILNHTGAGIPFTFEGQVVKTCDRIAYINHDIDDALRAKVLRLEELPRDAILYLGATHSKRIDHMIKDMIHTTNQTNTIQLSPDTHYYTNQLRDYMFEHVYLDINAKSEEGRARHIVSSLYYHFLDHPDQMSLERYEDYLSGHTKVAVKDYIAGMSDRFAVKLYSEIFIPKFWK